ncbi:hypothetical protein PLUTO_00240 [Luteibacter phage vB_LflM-Pluto]|uniref:DUF2786 domain-containing protein n=1 Tax=Luteibacter phage vB_LflM-Pluto TaxID=2948611 RepID=A0A9E7MUL1_9CAUD|nr:hypothetical protein PLUTO_00240 [Luteibacter phage vB_LflM-Pluto]
MEEIDIEKVKDRIAKLLRMAEDVSSPHEAAIAAQRARSLMDKYQIDASDLNGDFVESMTEERATRDYTNVPTYADFIAVGVAKLNDCHVRRGTGAPNAKAGRYKTYIKFQGFESDVRLCIAMFEYLTKTVDRLCKAHLVSRGITGRYPRDIGEAFKIACASELQFRLEAICTDRDSEIAERSVPGKELVIIHKREKVSAQFGEFKTRTVKVGGLSHNEANVAREAGRNAGRSIELQPRVNANRKALTA